MSQQATRIRSTKDNTSVVYSPRTVIFKWLIIVWREEKYKKTQVDSVPLFSLFILSGRKSKVKRTTDRKCGVASYLHIWYQLQLTLHVS